MNEKDILNSVDNVLNIVNKCVVNRDFTNMQKDLYQATAPMRNAKSADARRWTQVEVTPKPRGNWREQNAGRPMSGGHMEGQGNAFRGTYQAPRRVGGENGPVVRRGPKVESALFKKSEDGGAKAMFVLGLIGAIGFGGRALINLIMGIFGVASTPVLVILLVAAAALGIMSAVGRARMKRMDRYERYRTLLEEREFAKVTDLAEAVGLSEKQVKADLRSLMRDGYFKQAHFDAKEQHFIVSDDMYRMYQATEANAARMRREAEQKEAEQNAIPAAVREILESGQSYIQRIHKANDNIPDKGISDKLDRMESIVTRIFAEVRKNPSLAGNLGMFMDYYLPTTIKLVEAYEDMDKHDLPGENVRSAKAEISESLDTINDAFEKLLDSFFADAALDVSTDISVMKTMMKQEGLTDDDLTAVRKKQQMQAQIETGPMLKDMEEDIYGLGEANADGLVSMPLGGKEDF